MPASAYQLVAVVLVVIAAVYANPTNTKVADEMFARGYVGSTIPPAEVPECTSGHRRKDADGCGGDCFCLGGRWVCPEADCRKGNFLLKLRSNDVEPMPLRRNKRATKKQSKFTFELAERCVPHLSFDVGCHFCLCPASGIKTYASCTYGSCPPVSLPNFVLERARTRARAAKDAPQPLLSHAERCSDNEVASPDCVSVPLDGERCAPGITYMDECNTCICSQDGIKAHASCTFKTCPK